MSDTDVNDDKTYRIEAVDCAIDVMLVVAAETNLSAADIARKVGGSRQRIFRMIKTLEARGIIERASDGKSYRMGYSALLIGDAARSQIDLVRVAEPAMHDLCRETNETIQLRVRDGLETVCVARAEPERDVRVTAVLGRRRMMHAGSSKVFLAFMPEAEREHLLMAGLPQFTKNTITDPGHLRKRLEEIRNAGYSISRGEVTEELVSVTAPVFGPQKTIVAVLNLAAPASRASSGVIESTVPLVVETATRIGRLLGFPAGFKRPG